MPFGTPLNGKPEKGGYLRSSPSHSYRACYRKEDEKELKHLPILADLASGWSVNLTTFSQAIPSAYNAPPPPHQNKSPWNKSSRSFSYEVLHVPVRFGACSRSLLSWCDYSGVLLFQGGLPALLGLQPVGPETPEDRQASPSVLVSARPSYLLCLR